MLFKSYETYRHTCVSVRERERETDKGKRMRSDTRMCEPWCDSVEEVVCVHKYWERKI